MKKIAAKGSRVSKRQIRSKIQSSVNRVIEELNIGKPSKKVKKQILKASKKIAGGLASDLKQILKKMKKATPRRAVNGQKVKAKAAA